MVQIHETPGQLSTRLATKTVMPACLSKKQIQSLESYASTPLTAKKIFNFVSASEQVMLTYSFDESLKTQIPIFETRAIQPKMAFAKHLWECYELKCLHFIDNQFAPVKKRSWYNKHANERIDIICPYEWKRVGHLLESLKDAEDKNTTQDAEPKPETPNPNETKRVG